MSKLPPLLSAETFVRVVHRARRHGMGILSIGTAFALLAAMAGQPVPVMVWLLVAGTGAMALHGVTLLDGGQSRGHNWLVGGHVFCLTFILSLCAWQLAHPDLTALRAAMTDEIRASVKDTGLAEEQFLLLSYRLTWAFVGFVATLYNGTMALYYLRRREAVLSALESGPPEEVS